MPNWTSNFSPVDKNSPIDYYSLGRNGWAHTWGVRLYYFPREGQPGTVDLLPITSKGQEQRCNIEMPSFAFTELAIKWLEHHGFLIGRLCANEECTELADYPHRYCPYCEEFSDHRTELEQAYAASRGMAWA